MSRKELIMTVIGAAVVVSLSISAIAVISSMDVGSLDRNVTVTVIVDFGDGSVLRLEHVTTSNRTVFGALMEAARPCHGNFTVRWTYWAQYDSVLVDEINGIRNGEDGRYWQYWVNGEYGNVGADRYVLKGGEVVEWRFTSYG